MTDLEQWELCLDLGKDGVLALIEKLLKSRPGFEWANYSTGDWRESRRLYFQDYRPVAKALRVGRYLLLMANARDWDYKAMGAALQSAYSGRLNLVQADGKIGLEYCAGQYYPVEYRMAVVSVLCMYLDLDFDKVWNTRNWLYGRAV